MNTATLILNKFPDLQLSDITKISEIWDKVVSCIIQKMLEYSSEKTSNIHINLREEMIFELAKLNIFVSEMVVNNKLQNKKWNQIDGEIENEVCFNEEGLRRIEQTALNLANCVWLKIYNERWKKRTDALLEKENNPVTKRITVNKVEDNHFIPKSFIRRYWSSGQHIFKFSNTENGLLKLDKIGLGQWGFVKNLYSDDLEAYFGLLEGDAVSPIQMLLNAEPLNRPQRESLVGFIVIQRLRNPHFIKVLKQQMIPIVASQTDELKAHDKDYMRTVYETLYFKNDFYDKLARPILYSKWVVIKASNPVFVLPDTCNIFGRYEENQYVVMPITPDYCLVVLPIILNEIRIVPHYINADSELEKDLSALLMLSAEKDFLASEHFQCTEQPQEKLNEILKRVILSVITMTSSD